MIARSTRSGALMLAVCVICPALTVGLSLVFPLWVLPWTASFGVTRSTVMLCYALAGVLTIGMMPIAGRLLVRTPAWRLMALGGVVMGGGFFLLGVVTTYWQLVAVYSVAVAIGAGLGGLLPAQTLAVRRFPNHVGAIGGLIMIGIAIVTTAAPLLLTPLLATAGWRVAVSAVGAVILVTPPLAWTFLRSGARPAPGIDQQAEPAPETPTLSTPQILKNTAFWIILLGLLPLITLPTAVNANLVPFLADHGIGAQQAGYLLSMVAAGSALGALGVGLLADRVDPRLVAAGVAAAMVGALAALASGPDFARAAAAISVMGVAGGGILPLLSTLIFRAFGSGYAPAAGLMNFFIMPSVFGPTAIGFAHDLTGRYEPAFLLSIPVIVAGALVVSRFKAKPQGAPLVEAEVT